MGTLEKFDNLEKPLTLYDLEKDVHRCILRSRFDSRGKIIYLTGIFQIGRPNQYSIGGAAENLFKTPNIEEAIQKFNVL